MTLTVSIIDFVFCFDKPYVNDEHLNIRTLADFIVNISGVVNRKTSIVIYYYKIHKGGAIIMSMESNQTSHHKLN